MISTKDIKNQLIGKAREIEQIILEKIKTKMEQDSTELIEQFEARSKTLEKDIVSLREAIQMRDDIAESDAFTKSQKEIVDSIKEKFDFLVKHRFVGHLYTMQSVFMM